MGNLMNKAPKKIWVGDMGAWFENESSHDIPYIRADLVDELVEALKTCRFSGYTDIDGDYITTQHFDNPKVRAALKALEEE
jgi:hypothetical protein